MKTDKFFKLNNFNKCFKKHLMIKFGRISEMEQIDYHKVLVKLFMKAVAAVNPAKLISENLSLDNGKLHACDKVFAVKENAYLVGFGKAVLGMASQCEKILGHFLKQGIICCPENTQQSLKNSGFLLRPNSVIEVIEGARNNLPDENAERGAEAVIKLVKSLNHKSDILIVLISGGGSSLLPKPKAGIFLNDKLKTMNLLMTVGANIQELNTVRKKLSEVKGGGLANLAYPVQTLCFIISDVINDPLDIIASGPTVPNNDTDLAAFSILKKYNLENKVPQSVLNETKKVSSNILSNKDFPHVTNFLIGNNTKALNACKLHSQEMGFKTVILSKKVKGLVDEVSKSYIKLIKEILKYKHKPESNLCNLKKILKYNFPDEDIFEEFLSAIRDSTSNLCIIAGGEITVKVNGKGKGGRNQELALIMSVKLYDLKIKSPQLFDKFEVVFLSAGTDGIDGPTDSAGALGHADIIKRAFEIGIDPYNYILDNDSHNFYKKIDDGAYLIKTGHTGTNAMDVYEFIVYKKSNC